MKLVFGCRTGGASKRIRSTMQFIRRRWISALIVLLALAGFIAFTLDLMFPFPLQRLKCMPSSRVVTDRDGNELLSLVGQDQHRRRPVPLDQISPWLIQATIAVEDERFLEHPGVDPIAVARAALQNIDAGRTRSGASTITMQLARMAELRPRSWSAKLIQALRALQLDLRLDKAAQLECYLNIAPYGGNIRGVEAAARFYFDKAAAQLSLAESALLAGLPKAPSRLRPDRNCKRAASRRSTVLWRMERLGMISAQQKVAAHGEPIYLTPPRPPAFGRSAAWLAFQQRPDGGATTIHRDMQIDVDRSTSQHARVQPTGTCVAVLVIDIARAEIVAASQRDNARCEPTSGASAFLAARSPGSALKPFIYASAFEAGRLAPDSIVYDIPIERDGWMPRNFDREFLGEITVAQALRRSRNVPAILVAEAVGVPRCLGTLEAAGIRLPSGTESRGGTGIAVGSIEVRLIDLVNAYATIGRGGIRQDPRLFVGEDSHASRVLSQQTCAALDDILSSHQRRPRGMESLPGESVPWFMWKTGTSSGRRDAWAVGHNGRFAIGVWVGRLAGGGDIAFTGADAAEPLLAELFNLPSLRRPDSPPPSPPLYVQNPLPAPRELAGPLAILSPSDDAEFVAFETAVTVSAIANRTSGLTWFLNGRLADAAILPRVRLAPGRNELRCIDSEGNASAVQVTVRTDAGH